MSPRFIHFIWSVFLSQMDDDEPESVDSDIEGKRLYNFAERFPPACKLTCLPLVPLPVGSQASLKMRIKLGKQSVEKARAEVSGVSTKNCSYLLDLYLLDMKTELSFFLSPFPSLPFPSFPFPSLLFPSLPFLSFLFLCVRQKSWSSMKICL